MEGSSYSPTSVLKFFDFKFREEFYDLLVNVFDGVTCAANFNCFKTISESLVIKNPTIKTPLIADHYFTADLLDRYFGTPPIIFHPILKMTILLFYTCMK